MTVHPYTRLFPGKTTAPAVNDDVSLGYEVGDIWIDETNNAAYLCTDNTDGAAVWVETGAFDMESYILGLPIDATPQIEDFIFYLRDSDNTVQRIDLDALANNFLSSVLGTYFANIIHGHGPGDNQIDHADLSNDGSATGHVTNGDTHDHSGGDGNQIAYSSLSGTPSAETNTSDIYSCTSPGGTSAFVGTIATLPGGATLTYNVTSGTEGSMVPTSTSQLAKLRLYNTTRGTNALISNCNTGTNTLTLTANVPAGWQVGDTITIASQTVSGGSRSWIDVEITSGPTGKSNLFIGVIFSSATAGDNLRIHPFSASFSVSKYIAADAIVSSGTINTNVLGLYNLISNIISLSWTGTPTNIVIRESGYLS